MTHDTAPTTPAATQDFFLDDLVLDEFELAAPGTRMPTGPFPIRRHDS